jgi:8-oxo-dGTP diphosphatase
MLPQPWRTRPRRLADAAMRLALRAVFRLLLVWWRLRRPSHTGAVVALWTEGRVLLVAHSYRGGWGLPGGGVGRAESPARAALRELREELRLDLGPDDIALACILTDDWLGRRETVHIFEAVVAAPPALAIDHREIVAAEFVPRATAAARELPPHLRDYFIRHVSDRVAMPAGFLVPERHRR